MRSRPERVHGSPGRVAAQVKLRISILVAELTLHVAWYADARTRGAGTAPDGTTSVVIDADAAAARSRPLLPPGFWAGSVTVFASSNRLVAYGMGYEGMPCNVRTQ
jgi:hypothetical protein